MEASRMAATVARQIATDRKFYAKEIVAKLSDTEYGPSAFGGYTHESQRVPLAIEFVTLVSNDVSRAQTEYAYRLVSRWNVNPANLLADEFQRAGFADLVEQEQRAKAAGELTATRAFNDWQPYWRLTEVSGRPVLRYLAPDVAVDQVCVTCHNMHEVRTDIISARRAAGVETSRSFQLNELVGAIDVTIDLEQVGAVANANATTTFLLLMVGGVLSLLVAVTLVRRFINRPIRDLVSRFKDIAEGDGDLTKRVTATSDDEIGELGSHFNRFVGDLESTVQHIEEKATSLSSAAQELDAVSHEMSSAASQTSSQADVVSAAAEQVSTNVQSAATSAEELSASIKEIARSSGDAAEVATSAVDLAHKTNVRVGKLGESSAEIGNVIEVINSIAEQTNLLALNATIEAARAGDAGKGFAVVANEVKELAKETAKATGDIRKKIEAIQEDADESVGAIGQISTTINEINDLQNRIASAVEEQSVTTAEIGRTVAEAAEGTSDIAGNITSVAETAQGTTAGLVDTKRSVGHLAQVASDLQELIARFRIENGDGAAPS